MGLYTSRPRRKTPARTKVLIPPGFTVTETVFSRRYHRAQFAKSAPKLRDCPDDALREVAFAGRSNAGKSSAINTLTNQKTLARTSKTPGRTQLINYFALAEAERYLVDLPGYGYAKVSQATKAEWQQHLQDYLEHREPLCGLVLVMDIRHPLQDFDRAMLDFASQRRLPVHLLLTKADKLSRGAAGTVLQQVRKETAQLPLAVTAQTFSSLKRDGVEALAQQLDQWLFAED